METFTLQFADAQRVSALLRSLVDQGMYRPGLPPGASLKSNSPRDALAISVDPRSNTLLVSASPENLAIVREVIRKLDSKDFTDSTNVRLYALKKAKASSLANCARWCPRLRTSSSRSRTRDTRFRSANGGTS